MSDENSTHVVGCQCPRCGGEPAAEPQPDKGWLKPILEQARADINARPEWQKSRVVPAAPAPAAPPTFFVKGSDGRYAIAEPQPSDPALWARAAYWHQQRADQLEAELARLTSELTDAHAHVEQLCADQRELSAELEQVKAERDQYRRDWEHTDHMLKRSEERAIRAEAALREKGE